MRSTRPALLAVAATVLAVGAVSGSAAFAGHNDDDTVTVTGTAGADQIIGTRASERIRGRSGSDSIQGRRGMDFVYGDPGWDLLAGGKGSDLVSGGSGRDHITGGDGGDYVLEVDGDDLVNGGPGADLLEVGRGSDVVHAGPGSDLVGIIRDGRTDVVRCGPARDIAVYLEERDPLDRYRGCERVMTLEEFFEALDSGEIDPQLPPVLDSDAVSTQGASTPAETFRWAFRQLIAGTR